jgi:peptide/nickel transport system permease protein
VSTGDPAGLVHEADDHTVVIEGGTGAQQITARSPMQLFWRRLRRDRIAMASMIFIVALIVIAVLAPAIVSIAGTPDPKTQSSDALDVFGTPTGPSADHPFGVDRLGRDIFSRTVYGARVSLEVAFISTGIAVFIGVVVGLLAGFYRGWVDTLLSRLTDVVLAFPILLLGLGLAAACSGADGCFGGLIQPGLPVVIMVIAVINWTYIARIVRGQVLSLREKEFVEAARSLGASDQRIIVHEILPNLLAPLIVYSSLLIPANILLEAALSFLGFGVQPPTPALGKLIADGQVEGFTTWWLVTFPGIVIVILALAVNFIGDGLRDALDPQQRVRQ